MLRVVLGAANVAITAVRAVACVPVLPVVALASIVFAAWAITRGLRVMKSSPFAFPARRLD